MQREVERRDVLYFNRTHAALSSAQWEKRSWHVSLPSIFLASCLRFPIIIYGGKKASVWSRVNTLQKRSLSLRYVVVSIVVNTASPLGFFSQPTSSWCVSLLNVNQLFHILTWPPPLTSLSCGRFTALSLYLLLYTVWHDCYDPWFF